MTITDMIEKLQALRDEHGNAPIENLAGRRVADVAFDGEDSETFYITFE